MTNLVGTGEDNTSFNKTINKLNKKLLEEVGTGKSTDRPINVVEDRIKEIEIEKQNILIYADEKYNIEEKNKEIITEISKSEKRLETIKIIRNIKEQEKIQQEKIKLNEGIQEENSKKIEELKNKIEEAQNQKIAIIKEQNNKLEKQKGITKNIILLVALAILEIIILKFTNNTIAIISGIVFIIIFLLSMYYNYDKKNKIIKEYNQKQEKINQTINNLNSEKEILEKSNKENINNTKKLQEQINNESNIKIENIKNKSNTQEIEEILANSNINYQFENEQNKLNNLKLELHKLELENKNILPKLENLALLEEELEGLKEKYEELKNKGKSINLAKEYLQIAYEKMKESITPKFTKNLSENINKISNGKYKNVKFNDEKGLIIEVENGNYMIAENLSTGTIDQLYLSLRLATIDEISEEKLPIILDETFAYYDKQRLKNVLEFLYKECNNRQILIFTCTKREQEILQELNFEYKLIEM